MSYKLLKCVLARHPSTFVLLLQRAQLSTLRGLQGANGWYLNYQEGFQELQMIWVE